MSYNKKVWKSGDRITKEALNNMENGIEAAHQNSGGGGTSYDDTAIKSDINTIKTDLGTEELTTTAKDVKGAVNEVAAQYKDIENNIQNIGRPTDEQVATVINKAIANGDIVAGGLTTKAKYALLECFKHVAWIDANGQSYYNALETALLSDIIHVTGIELDKTQESIYTGYSTTLTATISPSNATDKSIVWTSSEPTVATIEGTGSTITINGIADGSSIITATTSDGGYIATFGITVATARVTGVSVTPTSAQLGINKSITVKATVLPAEAINNTITWSTNANTIAKVTPSSDTLSATITGVGAGSATITATTNENKKTASVSVEVSAGNIVNIIDKATVVANSAKCTINRTTVDPGSGSPIGVTIASRYADFKVISIQNVKTGDIIVNNLANGDADTVYLDLSTGTPVSVSSMVVKTMKDNYSWYQYTLKATKDIDLLYITYNPNYDDETHGRITWTMNR